MAAQSSVPPRVKPSKSVRRFTLAEANRTLPLVKRVVQDIVTVSQTAASLQKQIELVTDSKKQGDLQKELQRQAERMSALIAELSAVGAELKDPNTGLIDFVGRHQGRDVYLCWKLGEEQITHWHDLQAGFTGRKPVSQLQETSD